MTLNIASFLFLNGIAESNTTLETLVIFLADKFGLILLFGLIYYLFTHKDKKKDVRDVVVVLSAAILAWLISHVIKYIVASPRPFLALPDINQLIEHGGNDSFPSGHATFFSALATAIYFYHKRLGILYGLGALIIGIARVVAGIHWPIDILAGYILGGIIGAGTYYAYRLTERLQNIKKAI